jgi:hypothetical protein
MDDRKLSRRQLLTAAGALTATAAVLDPTKVLANDGEGVSLLRWDLAQIIQGTVLAGGFDTGKDATTGDTVTLSGSGEARAEDGLATGGGTFVHKHSNGSEVAHGVYVVTGFNSFRKGAGTLVGVPMSDGIDRKDRTTSGILEVNVALSASTGTQLNGTLTVECALPGDNTGAVEGIELDVATLHFKQNGGVTLFHVL